MTSRAKKLEKQFYAIIHGKDKVNPHNSPLFLEAIYTQTDVVACIERVRASNNGLDALQEALRCVEFNADFFNRSVAGLLECLSNSQLANIGGGSALHQILRKIVDPPVFWTQFVRAFKDGQLKDQAQYCFAWLLHKLLLLPSPKLELPSDSPNDIARDQSILDTLLSSQRLDTRQIAGKIQHINSTCGVASSANVEVTPGGRHDNDCANFREIAILPTEQELRCNERPFLRPSAAIDDPDTKDDRIAIHLDNQFRLLREDMLYDMREELQVAVGMKKKRYRYGFTINGLTLIDQHYNLSNNKCKWGIQMCLSHDLWQLKGVKKEERAAYLRDNKKFLPHQSLTCLMVKDDIIAFPTINRDEALLANEPPVIVLQPGDKKSTANILMRLATAKPEDVRLLSIDTAVFAYEPILVALQETRSLPLSEELLFRSEGSPPPAGSPLDLSQIVTQIKANPTQDLQPLLNTANPIRLDKAQADSLISGLTQKVSLIQGPPGTGKSFIGALLAKVLHDYTKETILVVCYTNHALDQFLEDLMDIGIPKTSLVRLGGKSTSRTEDLALQKQRVDYKRSRSDWNQINMLGTYARVVGDRLDHAFPRYKASSRPKYQDILQHLEFDDSEYFEAFHVPQTDDGMQRVGAKGRAIEPTYLLERWLKGLDAGYLRGEPHIQAASRIWGMAQMARAAELARWRQEMLREVVDDLSDQAQKYDQYQCQIDQKRGEGNTLLLCNKRIIGCTTTGAAKFRESVSAARAGVLLVEEAGEILESHILTALGQEMKQLILIGDHKQLRPKVNNYTLTVEKGGGFDLNRSLFERLVLKGYPHETLKEQHRMRPEISEFVRHLTYPDLVDAATTKNRPHIRGVRNDVVFVSHDKPEDEETQLAERREMGAKSSKRNKFEAEMVLNILRYLGQQGYGTDKIVVLTPYLGQLRQMQEELRETHDPVLNDMDAHDLLRAGLITPSAAKLIRKPIRVATIDNYQGEESDIVIVSLTRSNPDHDIGFMSSPERVNVLLSRARNALIMIGNADTFRNPRKGFDVWTKLFEMLSRNGHVYDGFPVRCERHNNRTADLKCGDDFDKKCPDGGCSEPCGALLNCGLHNCPSKCHQLSDHSKMSCEQVLHLNCPKGHPQQWKCCVGPPASCVKCDHEKILAERKKQEQFASQEKRDEDERRHAQKIAQIDEKIQQKRDVTRDAQLAKERKHALDLKLQELQETIALTERTTPQATIATPLSNIPQTQASSGGPSGTSAPYQAKEKGRATVSKDPPSSKRSKAAEDWEREKSLNGVTNNAIDAIMEMTGLEDVKRQVLRIKDKVDTSIRQNTTTKGERFNVTMLGNPGTGKTTVARHYGKFLASVQIIPGNLFVETTGSRLADGGVPGVKKQLEEVINAGGGTIFIDEGYQLTTEHSFQGRQVLDFLLAEMENNVGKIVFIFAGYNKEMEKFFEHNPGLKSRIPYSLQFKDYEDDELLDMLTNSIKKKYDGRMKVEDTDGIRGLYGRIAIRRLGRGRGQNGFGNARALANMFAKISERQAERVSQERRQGLNPDDFLLVKEDLVGPEPSKVMRESAAWKKLQSMIGLGAVKKTITNLFFMVNQNYQRELLEKSPHQVSLNRVFMGSPGTGKTTVAKHYGQILADLGLISNGEVVVKNPADFIGSVLGESEKQTKAILANTVGKVLVIDEAYMLYGGKGTTDPFKTAVIDTIVAEIQSVPGEDRCVLLLGYREQMEEMFQNVNPGLKRRFAIEDAFVFDDYTDSELLQALDWKLGDQDLTATETAKTVAIEVLSRARNRPNFGNIGEVENLLSQAKIRYQERQASLPFDERSPDAPFEPQDFDPKFDRSEHAATNLAKLFQDVVGCEEIVEKLSGWQQMAQNMKANSRDPREYIPTNFVFKGPPGTGKTTTARKMGQVYYDMGFLASIEVVECSASDLVGEYVGQTGPKTRKLFEKALGKVLFVDEAYRLSQGHFAKEAMDELVGILTQDRYRGKLLVILAGYDQEMNELLSVNTGLSSRFPETIIFKNLSPDRCLEVLKRKLAKEGITVDKLDDMSSSEYRLMSDRLEELSKLPGWGNARDVETLSKQMVATVFTSFAPVSSTETSMHVLPGKKAVECIDLMLSERQERVTNVSTQHDPLSHAMQQMFHDHQAPPPALHTAQTTQVSRTPHLEPEIKQENEDPASSTSDARDDGVTDEVWHQLQVDKQKAQEAERRSREVEILLQTEQEKLAEMEQMRQKLALDAIKAKSKMEQEELMRRREEARLREIALKEQLAKVAARAEEERKRRQEEARIQAKLRVMGVCVAGFRWIKQASGYRCAGGSHFVDNAALEKL